MTGKIYQTLPLYENLKTTGIYIYPEAIDLKKKTADVKVEAEVVNETGDYASITLSAVVVDADGVVRAQLDGNTSDLVAGQSEVFTRLRPADRCAFLGRERPVSLSRLFHPDCERQGGGRVRNADRFSPDGVQRRRRHGRRLAERPVRLAHRLCATLGQRLAGLGGAYPDWMHDFTLAWCARATAIICAGCMSRPQRADVSACDRLGIVEVCPAGDKERMVTGRQWDQRVEVMRDSMIFYRNNPSIFFWEAGNTIVAPEQMQQMVALRKQLDPARRARHGHARQ